MKFHGRALSPSGKRPYAVVESLYAAGYCFYFRCAPVKLEVTKYYSLSRKLAALVIAIAVPLHFLAYFVTIGGGGFSFLLLFPIIMANQIVIIAGIQGGELGAQGHPDRRVSKRTLELPKESVPPLARAVVYGWQAYCFIYIGLGFWRGYSETGGLAPPEELPGFFWLVFAAFGMFHYVALRWPLPIRDELVREAERQLQGGA